MAMDVTAPSKASRRGTSRRATPTIKGRASLEKVKAKSKPAPPKARPKARAQAERVAATKAPAKTPMLSFRMDVETRELVDHAARLAGQNRTDFMVTALREKAVEMILDRRLFLLNDTDWSAFARQLDEPPAPNAKLKALLSRKPVWDQ